MIGKGIKWIVYSNLWISINVVTLYFFCIQLFELTVELHYVLIVFFSTLFAYNFQRLLKGNMVRKDSKLSERHLWIQDHRPVIFAITLFSGLLSFSLSIYWMPLELMWLCFPAFFVVLFYVRGDSELKGLRNLPIVKIFLISIVWVFTVAIFPLMLEPRVLIAEDLLKMVAIYCFVFVLCIPFDIRDLEVDKGEIRTIPLWLGLNGSKILGSVILIFVGFVGVEISSWSLFITTFITVITLLLSNPKRQELFFSGWVDGHFLILFLIQLLGNRLIV